MLDKRLLAVINLNIVFYLFVGLTGFTIGIVCNFYSMSMFSFIYLFYASCYYAEGYLVTNKIKNLIFCVNILLNLIMIFIFLKSNYQVIKLYYVYFFVFIVYFTHQLILFYSCKVGLLFNFLEPIGLKDFQRKEIIALLSVLAGITFILLYLSFLDRIMVLINGLIVIKCALCKIK